MSGKNGLHDVFVRKGQVITTWGIGAIIPLSGGQSAMVSGLDQWDNEAQAFAIKDDRLAKKLKVTGFRCPPPNIKSGKSVEEKDKTIPLYVFPTLYYCSSCGFVRFLKPYTKSSPTCYQHGPDERHRMVPERFIVVCPNGHAMNLPILEKFQQITGGAFDAQLWRTDESYRNANKIYRSSSRNTASLAGISYHLGKKNSDISFTIDDLVKPGGLDGLYPENHCPGEKPWLNYADNDSCVIPTSAPSGNDTPCLRVVQRGGANVWIPRIESSIFIPEFLADGGANDYAEILKDASNVALLDALAGGGDGPLLACCGHLLNGRRDLEPAELLKQYKALKANEGVSVADEESEEEYRFTEYKALTRSCGKDGDDLFVKTKPVEEYDSIIKPFFDSISLVKCLKETQALVGFSRINGSQSDLDSLKKRLAKKSPNWLPAIQTLGEGIFFKFSETEISHWLTADVEQRAKIIDTNKINSATPSRQLGAITPPFVLIHTFAHAFINEVSKVCGYGSSSIRERLYVSSDEKHRMYGVLIYTSGSGSDASLGGLVRQGQPGYLESLIQKAIESIGWCADDPVCISSKGQGPDGCNLAACHNCCLLPETCCETGNRFLDRAMLVGNPAFGKHYGYFDSLLGDDAGEGE